MKLRLEEVSFAYRERPVLNDISFELIEGEILGLVGPNGSGKSTLLKCIDLILEPEGTICLDGKNISDISNQDIARTIAFVPQSPTVGMAISVFDMVLMGRRPHIRWGVDDSDVSKVIEVLDLLGIREFAFRAVTQISGGERQKVLIARALAQEPGILLLDEPTSALDLRHQIEVMEILTQLAKERKISIIIAIHDLNLASRYCDRLVMLMEGGIFGVGDPASLLTSATIRTVYGVEAKVVNHGMERPYIIPLRAIQEKGNEDSTGCLGR